MEVERIRNRRSYRRFAELYDWLATPRTRGSLLRKVHELIDGCYGFRSRLNSGFAVESIEQLLKDRADAPEQEIGGREWKVWVLCETDIQQSCEKAGVPFSSVPQEKKEEIARRFKKGFEAGCEGWWEECLCEAVRMVV